MHLYLPLPPTLPLSVSQPSRTRVWLRFLLSKGKFFFASVLHVGEFCVIFILITKWIGRVTFESIFRAKLPPSLHFSTFSTFYIYNSVKEIQASKDLYHLWEVVCRASRNKHTNNEQVKKVTLGIFKMTEVTNVYLSLLDLATWQIVGVDKWTEGGHHSKPNLEEISEWCSRFLCSVLFCLRGLSDPYHQLKDNVRTNQ